ncbi:hypothetical protein RYH80_08230 [Halobaculum sp. MBLA0147]|uniref:hypothetical protein n=1 Tax=Halobaculum sp. MBLA0147 TaxID=3079934 RepID=UPI0035261F45
MTGGVDTSTDEGTRDTARSRGASGGVGRLLVAGVAALALTLAVATGGAAGATADGVGATADGVEVTADGVEVTTGGAGGGLPAVAQSDANETAAPNQTTTPAAPDETATPNVSVAATEASDALTDAQPAVQFASNPVPAVALGGGVGLGIGVLVGVAVALYGGGRE